MAPRPTYDSPPDQLRALAVAARRRGLEFEAFWDEAVRPGRKQARVTTAHVNPPDGAVRWPSEWSEGTQWRAAIIEMKDGWRRAYEGEEPTRAEQAVRECGDSIGALAAAAEMLAGEAEPDGELLELMSAA